MAKSQHATSYRPLLTMLREMREKAGLTQRQLASRIKRPQPWVHKSEMGDRRLDVTEFFLWCRGCGVDPLAAFAELGKSISAPGRLKG